MSRARFMPELDGVRALAILAVLGAHAGVAGLPGGFVGVDLFFVLSGFLITSLLLDERLRTGRIRFAAFWARRARRLLPAALLMVAAVVAFRTLLPPDARVSLRGDAIAAALWSSNWRFAVGGTDYFAQGGIPPALQHTWSLGVEEQFYFCWPLLLALLWVAGGPAERLRQRLLTGALAGAALSAVLTAILAAAASPGRVYFGTDTRAQELLVGAALAAMLLPTWQARRLGESAPQGWSRAAAALSVAGLVVLLAVVHLADGSPGEFRAGLMTLVALASAALIAGLVLAPRNLLSRVFATRPAVALGRASYSVYLWHWPVFEVLDGERTGLSGPPLLALRLVVTALLATASLLFVELPAQRLHLRPVRLLPASAAAILVVVTFTACTAPAAQTFPQASAPGPLDAPPSLPHSSAATIGSADPGPTSAATAGRHTALRRHAGALRVDVFGDSIAWTLTHYLPALPGIDVRDHTVLGCGVVQGGPFRYFGQQYADKPQCDRWPTTWRRAVQRDRPDVVLLIVGRWETMDRFYDGTWTSVGAPAFDRHLAAELDQAVSVLTSTGARLVLANEPYNRRGEQPDGSLYPEDQPARVDAWNRLVSAEVARRPGVRLLDLNKKLCPNGTFTWDVDGIQIRSDGVHFTPEGVRWVSPWLLRALRSAAG